VSSSTLRQTIYIEKYTITFKRLSKGNEYFIEYKEIQIQHLFVSTTFMQDYNRIRLNVHGTLVDTV
jgi:hypothetical protein